MKEFLIRRFVLSIVTLLIITVLIFLMARAAGDPRSLMLHVMSPPEQWDELGRALGLDKPTHQQYFIFLRDMFKGDFGESIALRQPVADALIERLPATLELGLAAFILSLAVGMALGILSSVKRGSILDLVGKVVALIGQSAPAFWLGIMLIFFFAVRLGWLPYAGREGWNSFILPTITMGWYFAAANLRVTRSAMLDVLDSEYIKFAMGKGVSRRMVVWKHALRNSLIPPLTYAGVTLGSLVTGSLVTETVFAWPGLGQLAFQALSLSDYPLLQAIVIMFTLAYLVTAFFVDVLYAFIDPRIRYS